MQARPDGRNPDKALAVNPQSYIPGKDAPLEATIQTLQAKLQSMGFHIEEKNWLNPVEGIWSVHIRDRDCPMLFTLGKGTSRLACLASALGAFVERLWTNSFWTHCYLGPDIANHDFVHDPQERWFDLPEDDVWPPGILNQELHAFYNPEGSIPARSLVDFNSGHEERGICTLPYVRQRDGSTVYMPVNIMGNLYASNGMSAGNSAAEARTQALSEVFERHIKARIIGEGLCLPDVPEAVIKRYPRIAAGVAALRAEGFGILVKDASLGGQYPVLNITLLHPQDQGCLTSFGAHPRFEVALERALTELLQGRALDSLKGFAPPTFDLEEAASASNIERHFVDSSGKIHWNFLSEIPHHVFVDWNFSTTTTQDYAWLISKIHEEGFDIYISDLEHLGVYGCRILVPGMSEIYPVDDLDFENNSMANPMREAILNLSDLGDDECEDLLASLNESSLPDPGPVAAAIGMVADAGTFWADLRVGELKTLLALASGNEEATLEGCEWIRHFELIAVQRRAVYACVETLIQLSDGGNTGPYLSALRQLYGASAVGQAQALIAQTDRFMGLSAPGLQMDGCAMHQKLLLAYSKVQSMKAQDLRA
jgi:ribosomal protein S12 methylthiotransferase accessory factor